MAKHEFWVGHPMGSTLAKRPDKKIRKVSLVGRPNYVFDRSFYFQGEQSKVLHRCVLHGSKGQVLTRFVAKHEFHV